MVFEIFRNLTKVYLFCFVFVLTSVACGHFADAYACNITSFIPFSQENNAFINIQGSRAISQLSAALLAVHDFNTRNGAVVPELDHDPIYKNCSVYFPEDEFEVFNSAMPDSLATQLSFLLKEREHPPCAVIGPLKDRAAETAAVFAMSWNIPLITYGAQSPFLTQHKYSNVLRSCVDMHPMGEVIIQYLQSKGRTDFLGGIYDTKEFGLNTMEAISYAAKKAGFNNLETQAISSPYRGNEPNSIHFALSKLKQSTFRTVFIAIDKLDILPRIADTAEKNGMNGDDFFYVFIVPTDVELDHMLLSSEDNLNVTKLVHGSGVFRMLDGFTFNMILDQRDSFLEHWRSQGPPFVDRVNAKNPLKPNQPGYVEVDADYFQRQLPLETSSFVYDAIMMSGMGKCQELKAKNEFPNNRDRFVQGSNMFQVENSFVEAITRLNFTGATGNVIFQNGDTPPSRNRDRNSITYGVYNFVQSTSFNRTFDYYLTDIISGSTTNGTITQTKDGPFIFTDGTPNPPVLLRDVPNQNYLSNNTHVGGLCVTSICLLINILSILTVFLHWEKPPFRESQPILLLILLVGSFLMASSVLGQSFDESNGLDNMQLDNICFSYPLLLVLGFILTYGVISWKLLMRLQLKDRNVWIQAFVCNYFLLVGIGITLFVMMLHNPMKWIREEINADSNTGDSAGFCAFSHQVSTYHGILGAFMVSYLLFAANIAYKLRYLDERAQESKWIFYALSLQLQILAVGIPICIVLENSRTDAMYIARAMLIWTLSASTTMFIMGPKIYKIVFPADVSQISDSIWKVDKSELMFGSPCEIIGRGTFGYVLKAEYRGTYVAVKRVIPRTDSTNSRENIFRKSLNLFGTGALDETSDLKDFQANLEIERSKSFNIEKRTGSLSRSLSRGKFSFYNLKSTSSTNLGNRTGSLSRSLSRGRFSVSNLTSVSGTSSNKHALLKADFILDMRQLSKLRHPCITTVMGAVIARDEDPMLIMELMDLGSLYDVLHNETMVLDGEILLPILRDVAQGIRFLHAASPVVIHGDLKAANVLVDSGFRAKVTDFGLSQKKQLGATGTPYWMAPELLNLETSNTVETDVYSFGMILYEVYSRTDPYEGENFQEVLKEVVDPQIRKRPPVPESCPPLLKSMMNECLHHEPKQRPSFVDLDVRLRRLDADNVEPSQLLHSLQEKKRTDKLLYDVFPRHVAEALRDGKKVEPQHRDSVTIFFSDIVGFTTIAATLEPIKISDMLDRLYTSFDQLSRKHDVFKVETIGDAYMAITNLSKDQPDHAKIIAQFSIDVLHAANKTLIDIDDPDMGCVDIRVGIHSGPIVANVVGTRNPKYTVFGDTVNTAARMESNSIKNKIHSSESSAELIKIQDPSIQVRPRGTISVKGKGNMHTYWISDGWGKDNAYIMEDDRHLLSV